MAETRRVIPIAQAKAVSPEDALLKDGWKRQTTTGEPRQEYYERKIAGILNRAANINTSIVCEVDGKVVGFVMGYVFFGEFGIADGTATIDTLGVHPDFRKFGVAAEMLDQFMMNMKGAGVKKVYTLVNWDDFALEKFFSRNKFVPSKRINLEYELP